MKNWFNNRRTASTRSRRRIVPALTLLPGLPLLLALAGCDWSSQADTSVTDYRHKVSVVEVVFQPGYQVRRELAGEVIAPESPTVAFELAGQVRALLVDEGDTVTAGGVLARLDTQLLDAEADELESRAEEIRADLDLARRNLARIEPLEAKQLASERARDELASRVRLLQASLRRNAAALDGNRIRREKSQLLAPFDGRVRRRLVDEGAVVAAGAPVFELVQSLQREVRAGLPLSAARALAVGDEVTVRSGAEKAPGRVVGIGVEVDQGTRSQAIRVAVERPWAPGELAYLEIGTLEPVRGTWLPDTAVTGGLRGTWLAYVAVPHGDGEAVLESRTVTIEHASAGRLYVTGALRAGDRVVSGGLHRVAPGQQVRFETVRLLGHVRAGD